MRKVFLGLFCLNLVSSMAWADHPLFKRKPTPEVPTPEVFSIEDLGLSFQTIKKGSFTMGSPEYEEDRHEDENQVEVTISKDFEMQMTEVTQMQYFSVTGEKPSHFSSPEYCENYDEVNEICPDHPVEQVSWDDAKEFIRKLNASAGVEGCEGTPEDPRGCYRLPTEAEYEWAVRAGTETAYFFGDSMSSLFYYNSKWDNSAVQTYEVTYGEPNPNNLHGIIGNVWEWTADFYKPELEGGKDPLNMSKEYRDGCCRVLRGGGWESYWGYLRSAFRNTSSPDHRYHDVGFRLVRTL